MQWKLIRTEPYRLLFPMGIAAAAVGMGIWIPYYFWPHAFPYPGQGHAAIQMQGFLLCFVFGFLTTMLPKAIGIKPLDPVSFAVFPILLTGIVAASLAGAPILAQGLHLALLAHFLAFIIRRFPTRKSNPPPFFVFIAVAMLANLAGSLLKLGALAAWLSPAALRAGSLLQFQAFPLLLIMGVGGFLLPKLFSQGPLDPKVLLSRAAPGLAGPLILCGILVASFAIEITGIFMGYGNVCLQTAYALRAAAWMWFLFQEIRIQKTTGKLPPYLRAARISLVVMAVGLVMPVFRPAYMLAWEHVLFLSGFLRLTLSIASRVLAAHAGRLEILGLHARKVRVYGMLIVLAMMTRIATEFWPGGHWMHLAIAGALGLAALYVWGRIFLPLLTIVPQR